jgi:hypothetical protein
MEPKISRAECLLHTACASISCLAKNWILLKFVFAATQNLCLEATSMAVHLIVKEAQPHVKV